MKRLYDLFNIYFYVSKIATSRNNPYATSIADLLYMVKVEHFHTLLQPYATTSVLTLTLTLTLTLRGHRSNGGGDAEVVGQHSE